MLTLVLAIGVSSAFRSRTVKPEVKAAFTELGRVSVASESDAKIAVEIRSFMVWWVCFLVKIG